MSGSNDARSEMRADLSVGLTIRPCCQTCIDTYLAPDKTFLELREMINSGSVNPLNDFSAVCRAEIESLRAKRF
jgi:hypothetical protein